MEDIGLSGAAGAVRPGFSGSCQTVSDMFVMKFLPTTVLMEDVVVTSVEGSLCNKVIPPICLSADCPEDFCNNETGRGR